jgi:hypothetical protein
MGKVIIKIIIPIIFIGYLLVTNSCFYRSYSKPYDAFYATHQDTVITLERTMCYGPCPDYRLIIYGNGIVIFEGSAYVKIKKRIISKVLRSDVNKIVAKFEKYKYFSLNEIYEKEKSCQVRATDNPTVITSLKLNNKFECIEHYFGCYTSNIVDGNPVHSDSFMILSELENYIDEIINTNQWIK